LEGTYYDKNGNLTDEMKEVQKRIAEGRADREQRKAEADQVIQDRQAKDAAKNQDGSAEL
jgi:hypothetical protein